MHNELIHLGQIFRSRREERHLSLKEVENGTSIRIAYLQAIEEGHLGKLISPIYAQGFIKKYASYLELDGEQLIREHPYVLHILSDSQLRPEDFSLGIGSLEIRGSPGGEIKWLPNFLWVGLSVGIILLGWLAARYFGIL